MGLSIERYVTKSGIELEDAYLATDNFNYIVRTHELGFSMSLYASKEKYDLGFQPVDTNVISGSLDLEWNSEINIPRQIDLIVLQKIEEVEGKTDQEIRDHNASIPIDDITNYWMQYWDAEFQKFIGADLYVAPVEEVVILNDIQQPQPQPTTEQQDENE